MNRVLVVDDDIGLLNTLRIALSAHGYHVLTAGDAAKALRTAAEQQPDIVVLDLGLPDLDGAEVITALREHSTVPVVVLSARTDSTDKVTALDHGADDYVTKPFGIDELLARIRATLRRATTPPGAEHHVQIGDVRIDLRTRTVDRTGTTVHLTRTEWAILEVLVRNRGRLVTRQHLLDAVWGTTDRKDTSYLRVYLAQLRRKLEHDPTHPRHLITEPGIGYRLQP